jgi:hypothetical protein
MGELQVENRNIRKTHETCKHGHKEFILNSKAGKRFERVTLEVDTMFYL